MKPHFGTRFEEHLAMKGLEDSLIADIRDKMESLNSEIADEKSGGLGPGYTIGHSYFCHPNPDQPVDWFNNIIHYEILPLLREYWFDKPQIAEKFEEKLIIKDDSINSEADSD